MRTPPWTLGATLLGVLWLIGMFIGSWAIFIIFVAGSWSFFQFLLRLWGGS